MDPEDWGPLIASELIYMDRFQGRLWRGLLPRLTIQTILSLLVGILLWLFGIVNPSETITSKRHSSPITRSVLCPAHTRKHSSCTPSVHFSWTALSKNLRLMADREAVLVTGMDRFLGALNKVGKLLPKLMVGKRPDSSYPFDRPSIKRRIEAIQTTS